MYIAQCIRFVLSFGIRNSNQSTAAIVLTSLTNHNPHGTFQVLKWKVLIQKSLIDLSLDRVLICIDKTFSGEMITKPRVILKRRAILTQKKWDWALHGSQKNFSGSLKSIFEGYKFRMVYSTKRLFWSNFEREGETETLSSSQIKVYSFSGWEANTRVTG